MITTRRRVWIVPLLVLAACCARFGPGVRAAAEDPPKSITAGREAFSDGWFPWYDSQTDSLKALKFRDPPDWKPWNFGPVLNVVAWTLLTVMLAALVAALILFARNQTAGAATASAAKRDRVLDADQVEALPFLAERRRDDLLGQARFHYQQGNYSEAILYLFSYQLLQLDKYSVIHLAKGKTNRQYLREAARVAALQSALERTMLSFEGVFFGRRPLDRAAFETCWNTLPEFEQQLRAAT